MEHAMEYHSALIECVGMAQQQSLAVPCHAAALSFIQGYMEVNSPMNLIQAQRDCFGAHTYRLKKNPDAGPIHTNWLPD